MKIKNWLIFSCFGLIGSIILYSFVKPKNTQKTPIKVGICCGEPPYEYLDTNGNPQGYLKELMEKVFKTYGKPFKFEVIPFSLSFLSLNKGKIDFLCTNLSITPQREKFYDFAVLFKSQIVLIYRSGQNKHNIIYGVQNESDFERIAQEKNVTYQAYKNFQAVMLHFDIKKINGFICDLNTVKQLLEKNYQSITSFTTVDIQWNENILVINNTSSKPKIYGVLSLENTKYCGNNQTRLYYHLKDLLLAFRCGEINNIILKKNEVNEIFNELSGLQIKYNSTKFKIPCLSLKFMDNYWVIEKNTNKKHNIIGILDNNKISGYQNKIYNNWEIILNDLMEDKIDSIFFKEINDSLLEIGVATANINFDIGFINLFNGIAFRKNNLNKFDEEQKEYLKKIIENEAANDKNFNNYEDIKKKL